MKKNASIVILVAVILFALFTGGYVLFQKLNAPTQVSSTASSNNPTTPALNNPVLVTKTDASLGQYLAEPNGQALYTYGGDSSGVSHCNGSCLANWPAYQDKGATTNLPAGVGTIKRTDNGEIQYTYNGMPLYTFVGDRSGQVTGNGVGNFSVAKPSVDASSSTGSQPASMGTTSVDTSTSNSSNSSNNW